jgi:AcrR family transcriptional regulator
MTTTAHSGSGDINASLALLWDMRERPTRGPKPGLTLDGIVTAAVRLADAEGLEAVSMRRIAADLGVGTMSLYRYVPGKAELLDLMLDRVNECADEAELAGLGWRERLQACARGSWALYLRHPWLLQVDQSRFVIGPNALAGFEQYMRGLGGLDLSDPERVMVVTVVDGLITGIARAHVNAMQAEKRTGMTDEEHWTAQDPILVKAMATGNYPTLASLTEDAFGSGFEETFEFALQRLLDGLEAFVTRRREGQ